MYQFIKKSKKNLMDAILMNCFYANSNRIGIRECDGNHRFPR